MQYKHFTIEEREIIQLMLWGKNSIRDIAKKLIRQPSSVSRELKRNFPPERKVYTPRLAHESALTKRKSRGRTDRLKNQRVRDYVVAHLKKRWSPEQIANTIGLAINETICHEAIYQYIYALFHVRGYGYLKPGAQDLRPYLRHRRKRRQHKGARRGQRCFRPKGSSIDVRPKEVERRSRIGDWESDTVESVDHKPGINTLVERKSGLVLITKLTDRTSQTTVSAITERVNPLPEKAKRTVTFDNGSENSNWQELEAGTGIKTFFANPYRSWERGTNENTNGLIRDYFPKKTDFSMITDEEIKFVERELNTRPRKRLNWKTPLEVFSVALAD